MDNLQKLLVNKENQFREMSAQLLNHLNKINKLSSSINSLKQTKEALGEQLSLKEIAFQSLLKEKEELFEVLQGLESPETAEPNNISNEPEQPKIEIESKSIEALSPEIEEKKEEEEETPAEEIKEEAYISDEIDITLELQKLGLVDLIKKY